MKKIIIILIVVLIGFAVYKRENNKTGQTNLNILDNGGLEETLHPFSIQTLKEGNYPGSDIVIEQTLSPGSSYHQYIASYKSEGLKIYALMTVPNREKPTQGWPVIIFNHGYIPPREYQTTQRYVSYVDGFARNGYMVFKPDYRGHGNSEGSPGGAYGSNGYTVDVLNAVSSIKRYKDADSNRIGMWGHSMGGHITLKNMIVSKDIKAGVIWAGVVGSYPDLLNNWRRRSGSSRGWRQALITTYGEPEQNPQFWNSISANAYLSDISGPIQLHHGTSDTSVPVAFSEKLTEQLKAVGKEVELYTYPGDDHNISNNFSLAINRSVEFFDKNL